MSTEEEGLARAQDARKESVRLICIEAFLAVVEHGSFAAAQESLQVDATTAGRYVKQLEKWLGNRLFEDNPRMTLTPEGISFVGKATEVIRLMYRSRRKTSVESPLERRGWDLLVASGAVDRTELASGRSIYEIH